MTMTKPDTTIVKTLDVRLSISAFTNHGEGDDGWAIRGVDDPTGIQVFELMLTHEQMGAALAGRDLTIQTKVIVSENHGRIVQVERVYIGLTDGDFASFAPDVNDTAKRLLDGIGYGASDGWKLDRLGHHNRHRVDAEKGYQVTVRRYVDPT